MTAEMLNLSSVLRLNFCIKQSFCALISATSSKQKTVMCHAWTIEQTRTKMQGMNFDNH